MTNNVPALAKFALFIARALPPPPVTCAFRNTGARGCCALSLVMCPSLACCVVVSIATAGCAEDCTTATAAYTTALNGDCTTTASTACSPISTPGGACPDGIQAKVDNMYVECGGCGE